MLGGLDDESLRPYPNSWSVLILVCVVTNARDRSAALCGSLLYNYRLRHGDGNRPVLRASCVVCSRVGVTDTFKKQERRLVLENAKARGRLDTHSRAFIRHHDDC